jgi:hypothetical protein
MLEPRAPREHINDEIAAVLDPLAEQCRGWPVDRLAPMVRAAWRRRFHSEISRTAAADTATAIHEGRPWSEALWIDGW